jgi:hypothetical protein
VIIQFAKGDPYAPNPTTTAFLRAGDLADRATYYLYDQTPVYYLDPILRSLAAYPHTFGALITFPDFPDSTIRNVALAAQQQIAVFLKSGGTEIIQPPGVPEAYFEVPIQGPLPEGLNYPGSAPAVAPALAAGSQASGAISSAALTEAREPPAAPALFPTRTALPTSALVDLAIEALPPIGGLDSALDVNNLAVGLLTTARRRR